MIKDSENTIDQAERRAFSLQLKIFRMRESDPNRNRLIVKMNRFQQVADRERYLMLDRY